MPDGAAMEGQLRRVLAFCPLPCPTRRRLPGRVGESRSVRTRPGCNQRASAVQINANKRKQNCFLLLSFTIVYFLESGLFNSLQAIQIKNSAPSQLASEVVPETSRSGDWENYSTNPGFWKEMAPKSWSADSFAQLPDK
jgi:hypothetical protein